MGRGLCDQELPLKRPLSASVTAVDDEFVAWKLNELQGTSCISACFIIILDKNKTK